jgi:hypothetical protein
MTTRLDVIILRPGLVLRLPMLSDQGGVAKKAHEVIAILEKHGWTQVR